MRAFENWTIDDVCDTFGIKEIIMSPILLNWVQTPQPEWTETEKVNLEKLKHSAMINIDGWNEDELKLLFIGPILQLTQFDTENYRIYSNRKLTAEIEGHEVGGIVDFMIASGKQKPKKPYFFIHEYKQEKKRQNDPIGQLLIEMLAAQAINGNQFPMYGAYVLGRNWFFVVLHNKTYSVSNAYPCSLDYIYQIVTILRKVNDYITAQIEQELQHL